MSTTSLSELMSEAARELQDQPDAPATMQASVELAVRDVDGADGAALSIIRRGGKVETLAASSEAARRGDELQYETRQGPCLDAAWEERWVHSPDFAREERWPAWTARVTAETGFHSLMAFQLFTTGDAVGAMNLYSRTPHGFDATDRDHGLALASHVAIAVRGAQEAESLRSALDSRTRIATAVGIVMERYHLDNATAFAVLTRLASTSERKLRDIAEELVRTDELPGA